MVFFFEELYDLCFILIISSLISFIHFIFIIVKIYQIFSSFQLNLNFIFLFHYMYSCTFSIKNLYFHSHFMISRKFIQVQIEYPHFLLLLILFYSFFCLFICFRKLKIHQKSRNLCCFQTFLNSKHLFIHIVSVI